MAFVQSQTIADESLVAVWLIMVGCGPSPAARHELQGNASFAGRPIPAGLLVLTPDLAAGGGGPQGAAVITQGRFSTRHSGRGVRGGRYTITLHGFDGTPYDGMEERVALGRPLFAPVSARVTLPDRPATLALTVHEKTNETATLEIAVQ